MTKVEFKNQANALRRALPGIRDSSIEKCRQIYKELLEKNAQDSKRSVYTGSLHRVTPRAHYYLDKMEKAKLVQRVGGTRRRYFIAGEPYLVRFPKGREIETAVTKCTELLTAHLDGNATAQNVALPASGAKSVGDLQTKFNQADERDRLRLYDAILTALTKAGIYDRKNGYPVVLGWQTAPDKWYLA